MVDVIGAAATLGLVEKASVKTQQTRPQPKVIGPIDGGTHGWPFSAYFGDIGKLGYSETEYFIEGTAQRYQAAGPHAFDGVWPVEPTNTAAYRTRILVHRPVDPARFNGTVIVEWINVSSGFDVLIHDLPVIFEEGFAYVGVSAQSVGVDGVGDHPRGLKQWDPARYGTLNHPGDSYCYDIFSQAALALGPSRSSDATDPLVGLEVQKVIAAGASQSAARMTGYVNAIHNRDHVFDGFLIAVSFGLGSGLSDEVVDLVKRATLPPEEARKAMGVPAKLREDIAVPILVLNSETECLPFAPTRRPDTDRFRYWELAGSSHFALPMMTFLAEKNQRDFASATASVEATGAGMPTSISHISWIPTASAATLQLDRWVKGHAPPSEQPLIELEGTPAQIVRDASGNAKGGIRLPEIEVPTAQNDGVDNQLFGHNAPFSADQLKALYPSHKDYVDQVTAAAAAVAQAGVILPDTEKAYIEAANAANVPPNVPPNV